MLFRSLSNVESEVVDRVAAAVNAAEAMPEPPTEWALEDVYADPETLAAFGGSLR